MGLFRRKPKDAGAGRPAGIRRHYQDLPRQEWSDDEFDDWFDHLSDVEYWAYWEEWSRDTVEHPRVKSVRRSVLRMGAEASKASYPQEFGCMLRLKGSVIEEVVLVPGTIQGDSHAIFMFGNLPVDRSINGTLHSHPSPHPYPSDADFELFEAHGMIHLIFGHPYGPDDWRCYDHTGTPTRLEVIEDTQDA